MAQSVDAFLQTGLVAGSEFPDTNTSAGADANDDRGQEAVGALKERQRHEIGRGDYIYNRESRQYELHKSKSRGGKAARWTRYVLVVRRRFTEKDTPSHVEIEIRGSRLREALESIHKDDKSFAFTDDPPLIEPRALFHSFPGLQAIVDRETEKGEDADKDLLFETGAGIKYILEDFSNTLQTLRTLQPKNQISWSLLWTIFPSGTVIVGHDQLGQEQAWVVRGGSEWKDQRTGVWYYRLEASYVDSNGRSCGWVDKVTLDIAQYEGVENVPDLRYWPIKLHPDAEAITARRREAGRAAMKRHGQTLVEYHGQGLRRNAQGHLERFHPTGRLMLDPETFDLTCPQTTTVPDIQPLALDAIDDQMLVLMSSSVYGMSLGNKVWGTFSVAHTEDPSWSKDAFKSLEVDEIHKSFIFDLVQQHAVSKEGHFDDIIRGKGRGLIGLLEGPPGVGKTLTAEAVAEVTKKPLYSMSAGELGDEASDMNHALKAALELTQRWNAVLLLDEADVFLAARSEIDIKRNAIISIFLRELEYYTGIMLLTTNRLESFDPAFESRVHFCVEYPELSVARRQTVWERFLQSAQKNQMLKVDIDDEDLSELANLDLNGRQIRNAVGVSQAVAVQRNQPLTIKSIKTAIRLSKSRPVGRIASSNSRSEKTSCNCQHGLRNGT